MEMMQISGSTGFWIYVGLNTSCAFKKNGDAFPMKSDWVPCSRKSWPLHIHRSPSGYFRFHLPNNGDSVYFARQLLQDIRGGGPLPANHEAHHKDFDPSNNMSANLELVHEELHRELTAANRRQRRRRRRSQW